MGAGIGAVLPFAIGVGVSPIPIVAGILVLFSQRARTNGPLFLLGWVVSLAALVGLVTLLADGSGASDGGAGEEAVAWGKVAVGVLLVAAGARKWAKRPRPGDDAPMPRWMASIDAIAPVRALGLGALLAVNPKNLALGVAAGATLAGVGPSVAEAAVGVAAFVVVGSAALAGAVAYHRWGGEAADAKLDRAKTWLTANNAAVMAVLFVVFGVLLVIEGLATA
jgi:hypothetical protein